MKEKTAELNSIDAMTEDLRKVNEETTIINKNSRVSKGGMQKMW